MKWGWLLTAVALAVYLLARRRKLGRATLAAGVAATVVAVLIGTGVIHLPNIEKLIEDVGTKLGKWTYLLVGTLAYLETGAFVGLIAPGETAVLVGGVVAGQGQISLLVLIAIVWTCAVAGDLTSYTLGRRLGRSWLLRHGDRLKITEARLHQVERFFERRGGLTILVGRFIGLVRALAPFIAGTSRMPLRVFLPYDVVGAGAWSITFCVLGYVFWRSFSRVTQYVSRGLFAFGTVVALGLALYALVRLRRDPVWRETARTWLHEHEDRPFLRPLVRLAGPLWRRVLSPAAGGVDATARFGLNRLTPGNLGLELTTLIALASVGTFTFVLLGEMIQENAEPRIDRWAADIAHRVRFSMLTDVAKVVTNLGALPVAGGVVLVTALFALHRRRVVESVALIAGMTLVYAAVHIAKGAYDRPRPSGELVDTVLSAYPSGHSAYAVAWVVCALVLVRAGVGWAVRFAVLFVAIGIVAAVALSRVYLRAHYLTDVLGGVALGVAIWSLVGIAALFAGAVRHNEAPKT
jgi:membrane protein DedA with SNARE-associated domain/membrane-associated phospholipid phosphatase